MKWKRWILMAGVVTLAACSNPTGTGIPEQEPTPTTNKKSSTGFVVPVTLPAPPTSLTG